MNIEYVTLLKGNPNVSYGSIVVPVVSKYPSRLRDKKLFSSSTTTLIPSGPVLVHCCP